MVCIGEVLWDALPSDTSQAVETLSDQFGCSLICITQGANGAILYQDGEWCEHEGYRAEAEDSVGAGDAFLATLIYGIQNQQKGEDLLRYANAAGSFVAPKSGATPEYGIQNINELAAV